MGAGGLFLVSMANKASGIGAGQGVGTPGFDRASPSGEITFNKKKTKSTPAGKGRQPPVAPPSRAQSRGHSVPPRATPPGSWEWRGSGRRGLGPVESTPVSSPGLTKTDILFRRRSETAKKRRKERDEQEKQLAEHKREIKRMRDELAAAKERAKEVEQQHSAFRKESERRHREAALELERKYAQVFDESDERARELDAIRARRTRAPGGDDDDNDDEDQEGTPPHQPRAQTDTGASPIMGSRYTSS